MRFFYTCMIFSEKFRNGRFSIICGILQILRFRFRMTAWLFGRMDLQPINPHVGRARMLLRGQWNTAFAMLDEENEVFPVIVGRWQLWICFHYIINNLIKYFWITRLFFGCGNYLLDNRNWKCIINRGRLIIYGQIHENFPNSILKGGF